MSEISEDMKANIGIIQWDGDYKEVGSVVGIVRKFISGAFTRHYSIWNAFAYRENPTSCTTGSSSVVWIALLFQFFRVSITTTVYTLNVLAYLMF